MEEDENDEQISEDAPWEMTIRRADNGFIITRFETGEDGRPYKSELLIEDREEKHDEDGEEISHEHVESYNEAATMKELFWAIEEFFGYSGSKHDKYRLRVHVEKQNVGEE